ncbi:MAG: hypothetical protein A2Y03_00375 [Omnitrophica WOR_2 bacterium GWF2_38_59]|nr:MAG: hypothetical protein A2Y06_06465 [Omnitrophica WOR_2 bacterium GWA2_37_7]OGX26599.1 MAG: hypothetical protein A2Y03_00375 [Omnitrophica WOR_2 bacterium GWF2_38_59]OGX47724.1 MAG: hypothetical protein A2243_00265 [Omnitrophica WOR_2 bacterium RIFOXYA2_FULL_38_17]OGX55763.1 MAG: hypothetical protein A2306_10955 [Omnitrophica WOR_2 bacterium RIFOXYB2_FULL_38_16]OGX57744.1 MAG: hypothetical protein A2447_06580 [Omnitrophica WOR_2 bacterium RIFOXYC2_FULL_38_12]HBG60396.1 hypothetical protei
MNKKQNKKRIKIGCLFQIIIMLMCPISFFLSEKVLAPPIFSNIGVLQGKIEKIDRKLYDILLGKDKDGRAWYLSIEKKEEDLKIRSEDNDRLYESIGPNEVIRKGFWGNARPVGKYADYLAESRAIEKERLSLEEEKVKVAAERGGFVDDVEGKELWKQRMPLMKELEQYEKEKADFYKTEKGLLIERYSGFFYILGIVCFLLTLVFGAKRMIDTEET